MSGSTSFHGSLSPLTWAGCILGSFLVAQTVKNLPAMQETPGLIPGLGRSPGEEMATHSSILAWRTPWTEEPGGLQSVHGVSKSQADE